MKSKRKRSHKTEFRRKKLMAAKAYEGGAREMAARANRLMGEYFVDQHALEILAYIGLAVKTHETLSEMGVSLPWEAEA